jgi:hypothetical protein
MKYWLDTEFIEDGKTIDLISIGVVAEDGRELYLLNVDCDWTKASQWVKDNVLASLPSKPSDFEFNEEHSAIGWVRHSNIGAMVHEFVGGTVETVDIETDGSTGRSKIVLLIPESQPKPEFWAYYADYDWVALCQCFGTMMDLPKGFPMYCRDIKQWCDMLGNPKLPEQGKGEHNALEDARHNRVMWESLNGLGRDDYDEYEMNTIR